MGNPFNNAAVFRELIKKLVAEEIKLLAPQPRTAIVQRIDAENNTAWVSLPGDTETIKVAITPGAVPRQAAFDLPDGSAPADTVRIAGGPGGYYMTDVLTSAAANVVYEQDIENINTEMGSLVTEYVTEYQVGNSETVAPTGTWSTDTPTRTAGTFIWTRVLVTRQDGSTSTTAPALLTGNTGSTGSQGIPGTPGANGTTFYTWLKYATSATPVAGDMSDSPTGKTYMGIAVGRTSSTESLVYTDYNWSLIQGPQGNQGIPGTPGADGVTTYTWVKYADNASGLNMTDTPTGKTYIGLAFNKTTATESSTATDYQWSLIQGPQGNQGIPGTPGTDGVTYYTWLKYADSPTTGMSDSPTGKTYMGIAVGKTTATESATYTDYNWSLIQGPQGNQGIPGTPGSDGVTTYTWVKYADNASGLNMADVPTGKTYIGLAFNKTTATESNTATDYQWSLIQGPQGTTGGTGATGTSITAVTPYFATVTPKGAAAPAQPAVNTVTPSAPWVATEPAFVANTDLYRTERITYSNGNTTWTTVTKSSSYAASTSATETANAALVLATSDGLKPGKANNVSALGGIRNVRLTWDLVTNRDPVTYKVYGGTTSTFTVNAAHFLGTATSNWFSATQVYNAATLSIVKIGSTPVDRVFYFKIVPSDADGDSIVAPDVVSSMAVPITGPDVSANYVYTNTLVFDQIVGGTMKADVTLSGMFRTAAAGQRAEMSGQGFFAYNVAGLPVFSVPTNPTESTPISFDGIVNARNLTVEDDLEIRGVGQFAPGSVTTLAFKQGAPTAAPNVTPSYPKRTPGHGVFLNYPNGWSIGPVHEYWSGQFDNSSLIHRKATGSVGGGGPGVQVAHAGEGVSIHEQPTSTWEPMHCDGVLEVWDSVGTPKLLTLNRDDNQANTLRLRRYDVANWPIRDDSTRHDNQSQWTVGSFANWWYAGAIGPHFNRAEYVIAQVVDDGSGSWDKIKFEVRNWETSGAPIATYTTTNVNSLSEESLRKIRGCGAGSFFGDGINRYYVVLEDRVWFFTCSGTVATFDTPKHFFTGQSDVATGTFARSNTANAYAGFKTMAVVDGAAEVVDYTEVGRDGSVNGTTHYATSTWAKHSVNPTGYLYETTESSAKQFTWPKRGLVVLSQPSIPVADGDLTPPDSAVFYVGAGAPSTRLNRWLQAELPVGVLQQTLTSLVTSGVNAPSANTFPNSIPARLKAGTNDADGSVVDIGGDGIWRMGHLRGKMEGSVAVTANPIIQVRRNATQAITNNQETLVSFDTADVFKNAGTFTPGTAVTVPRTGLYEITGGIAMNLASGTPMFLAMLAVNGLKVKAFFRHGGSPSAPFTARGTIYWQLTAGDTIGLLIFHTHTASVSTNGGIQYPTELLAEFLTP